MSDDSEQSTEARVLAAMKNILMRVAKETATPAGSRRILSLETIHSIRDCLALISARERELAGGGDISAARPTYPEQRVKSDRVEVSLDSLLEEQDKRNKH